MKHLRAVNKKARRIDEMVTSRNADVVALQQQRPHVPMGCTLSFSPGWEVDSAGGTAGLSASPWNAISMTVTSPASGPLRCRII